MINYKLSAFSDEYADSFEDQLIALNRFEIGYTEVRYLDRKNVSLLTEEEVKLYKKKLDYYGISVSAIGSPLGKIKLDGNLEEHFEAARRVFNTANIFGTKFVRIFSFYAPDGEKIVNLKQRAFSGLERLLRISEEQGIVLCIENEAMVYGDTPTRCREIIDHFDGKIKCVFDMGNYVLEGIDPYDEGYKLLKNDIAYFHIKDALSEGAIVPPGKGEARIKEIISAHMRFSEENFFVSLEPHLETFSGLNALVGRPFKNPYQYPDKESAFADAVDKFRSLI